MPRIIVFSGAGLSAESGLSTFRNSPDGLWENYDLDVVCNYRTWRKNFALVHEFYNMRRQQLATAEPNAAHRMIADWQTRYDTVIITQNVDDLLERAGCKDVLHLHGFLPELVCDLCRVVWTVGHRAIDTAIEQCPRCKNGINIKPNVVFFGQDAPRYRDLSAIFYGLQDDDVVAVSGTSGNVINIDGYLAMQPGYKIFNALEEPWKEAVYNDIILEPATQAFVKIDTVLRERWG